MNTKSAYIESKKSEILSIYESGESFQYIANSLGVCKDTLRRYAKIWGMPVRLGAGGWNRPVGHNRVHARNSEFFSVPTPQNCYWAGFIAADGNITDYGSVRIAIDSKDAHLLEKFKEEVEFTGEINEYKYNRELPGTYKRLEICDPGIVKDLERLWNITPRKTMTLMPPNITDVYHTIPFIVGYIDGDGSISKKNSQIQICGNLQMVKWIRTTIAQFSNIQFTNNIYKCKSIFSLRFQGKNAKKFFHDSLNVYNGFRLHRKWSNI